jgi:hypothetical protein
MAAASHVGSTAASVRVADSGYSGDVTVRSERALTAVQAVYYTATGGWPLADRRSFESVTGRKRDYWLVQTVGALAVAIGAALAAGVPRKPVSRETRALAVTSAIAFAAIDLRHGVPGRIRRVYVADAAVQLALVAAWALAARGRRRATER